MNGDKNGAVSPSLLEAAAWLTAVSELGVIRRNSIECQGNWCHVRFCMLPHEEAWSRQAARVSFSSISVIAVCPLVPQYLGSQRFEP